jgi:hypothetical protein
MSNHTISTETITPFPLRVKPRPWEDLHSYLVRTTKRMQYEKVTQVIQPEVSRHRIAASQLALLTEQEDYTLLSRLCLLSEDTLYQMTLHRFWAPFAQLDFFPIFKDSFDPRRNHYIQPQTIIARSPIPFPRLTKGLSRTFFLPNHITQICPFCLQEEVAYDRLYWKARHLLTCHKHAILLLRHCPFCSKRIPSLRLELLCCPFCHHPYFNPSNPPLTLPPDASALPHGDFLTLHALGVSLPADTTNTSSFTSSPLHDPHDPRTTLPPEQYFSLLRAICLSLHPLHAEDVRTFLPPALYAFLEQAHLLQSPYPNKVPPFHIAAAHWIFTQWPTHFFHFLDALQQWAWKSRKKHAFRAFPHHFLLGAQAHEARAFLSQAFRHRHDHTAFP